MTDLTIEHEGETLYVVEHSGSLPPDVPGGTVEGRRHDGEWYFTKGQVAVTLICWTSFTHYAVTLAQRIAMLGMVAADGRTWELAPDDWDRSKPVLRRSGEVNAANVGWWRTIVGYTPLAKPATPALPTYDPATHVPVRRMTEAECDKLWEEWIVFNGGEGPITFFARRFDFLIEPTPPTRFEALCAKHGVTPGQPFDEALFDKIMGGVSPDVAAEIVAASREGV